MIARVGAVPLLMITQVQVTTAVPAALEVRALGEEGPKRIIRLKNKME
jgi:hypothetical protein